MENYEYNRLICNNKLEELSEIWNISDLTQYTYLNKYLLEYLLEKNIHTTRMDSQSIKDIEWTKLYLKYSIIEPLINLPFPSLIERVDNIYVLDLLLDKMNNNQKELLLNKIKYESLWFYLNMEEEIIEIFKKHNFNVSKTFVTIPRIANHDFKTSNKINSLLDEFIKTYSDHDKRTIKTILEELKRTSMKDKNRVLKDIKRLIEYKQENKEFRIVLHNIDIINGEYDAGDNHIFTDKYVYGIFNHELSHMLLDQYEDQVYQEYYSEYCNIRKEITKKSTVKKIITYLKEFHSRVLYMRKIFQELYLKQIEIEYDNVKDYYQKIYNEIETIKPEKITLDSHDTEYYIDFDNIDEAAKTVMECESNNYANICVNIYYREEVTLENLLDALLRGKIHDLDYGIECLSGHTKKYFKEGKYASFDECLANYDEIKSSIISDRIINKLSELVGEDLVIFLDSYLEIERGSKKKKLKKGD